MWLRVIVLVLAGFHGTGWAKPPQPKVIDGAPEVYTVKKGDTLWDISAHFLSSPWLWPTLWQANDYIKNPHLIYPGDQIHLVWVNGQPRLQLKRHLKLSPQVRIVRAPITTLQSSLMLPFLAQDKLMTPAHMDRLPRVVGSSRARDYMAEEDLIWADTPLETGDVWWVYRPDKRFERELANGDTREVMGLKEIARAKVTQADSEKSALTLTTFLGEVRQNDILLPAPLGREDLNLSFAPSAPPADVSGSVVGHLGGMRYIATHDPVVIDLGHLDGVQAGHVFNLYRAGAGVVGEKGSYDYQGVSFQQQKFVLSQVPVGEMVVIRAYEHFALGVVTRATQPFVPGTLALPPHHG